MKKIILALLVFNTCVFASDFRKRINEVGNKYTDDDITAEIKFGKDLAARVLGKYNQISDKNIIKYVSIIGTGISAQVGRPELVYYFAILDTDDVNAYACPGGYVFITKGALKLMDNEAQLAGVIAHELTHINNRHVVKQLKIKGTGSSSITGLASMTSGATASARLALEQVLDNAMNLLFEKGVEKKDEFESDVTAANILIDLGFDWKSYRDYISKIKVAASKGKADVISKTHPTTEERIKEINSKIISKSVALKINKKRFIDNVKI